MTKILSILLLAAATSLATASEIEPLQLAEDLGATKYRDYTYGSTGYQKVDCVQFVLAVVETAARQCGERLTSKQKKAITVQLTESNKRKLQQLVESEDENIRGVQAALIEAGLGCDVDPSNAAPGDLVQYWYISDGEWAGHAGIIEKVDSHGRATIYGSHQTTLQRERHKDADDRKGGVGSGPVFDLTDDKRKVFLVRWTAEAED